MTTRILIATLFFFVLSGTLTAQEKPQAIIDGFFERLENTGTDDALDYIYGTNPWMSMNQDAVKNLKNQMSSLNDETYIGKLHGHDLITTESIGPRFLLYSYLLRYDRQPIRFTFLFYRPSEEWRLHAFEFDGNVDEELKESAKIYFLDNGY
ncbi:MAG: hypothetical protein AAGJ82_06405 [Bacteroidota bacterium]